MEEGDCGGVGEKRERLLCSRRGVETRGDDELAAAREGEETRR